MRGFARLVALGAVIALSVPIHTSIAASKPLPAQPQDNEIIPPSRRPPVAEYASQPATAGTERFERSHYYDRAGTGAGYVLDTADPSGTSFAVVNTHWAIGRRSLPVDQCELIVLGTVTSATAHMSNDKSSVYSEYDVRVQEVLKNQTGNVLTQGDTVAVEREGGEVRYPNGGIVRYEWTGQGVPKLGERYLLFLKCINDMVNLEIWTGYEFSKMKVTAIDHNLGSDRLSSDYTGVSGSSFVKSVKALIATPPSQAHRPGKSTSWMTGP